MSIIFLANGIGSDANVEDIINHIANFVDNDIIDYGFVAYETLMKSAQENVSGLKNTFAALKKDPKYANVNLEEHLNRIGYVLLYHDQKVPEAVSVFSLNAKEYPKSSNVYDSLAEAYEVNKDIKNALLSYTKAAELNTDADYRARISKKITELKQLLK